jgi:hypothetical protein
VHFDPTLFFGFEEMDVGLQIRRAGGRVVIDGDWLHAARARAGKLGRRAPRRQERARAQWRTYYSIRNYLLVSRRHCSSVGRVRAASLAVGMVLRRALVPSRWSDLAPALAGLRDGLLGVTGRVLEP